MIYYNKLKELLTLIKNNINKKELKKKFEEKKFVTNDIAKGNDKFYKKLLENDIILLKDYLYNTNTNIDIKVFLYQLKLFDDNTNNKLNKINSKLTFKDNPEVKINKKTDNFENNIFPIQESNVTISDKNFNLTLKDNPEVKINEKKDNVENNKFNIQEYPITKSDNTNYNLILKNNIPKELNKNTILSTSEQNITNYPVVYNNIIVNNHQEYKILKLLEEQKLLINNKKKIDNVPEYPISKYELKLDKKNYKLNLNKKYKKIKNKNIDYINMKNNKKLQITGGNDTKEYNLNNNEDIEKLKKELEKLNTKIDTLFNDPKTIMSIIILSNKINESTEISNIFIDFDNLKFFFIKIQDTNKGLLDDLFDGDGYNIKNYNIKNNYKDIVKVMNLNEILNRDSIYGNFINNTTDNKYIFIYTLVKILYLEFDNIIEKIKENANHRAEFIYFYEQFTYNLNGLIELYKKINELTVTEKYKEINKNVEPKLLTLLRFRHDIINNDFNHIFGITKASDYEKKFYPNINHINNFLDDGNIGNNNNVIFNYLNLNKPEKFTIETAMSHNKLQNIKDLQELYGFEEYTCTFNSIYNPYISLKDIGKKDENIKKLKQILTENKETKKNVIIMGLGQSGVGKTSFLLGYEYNGLNEGIIDQLITVDDVTQVTVKEFFLDKNKNPTENKSGPINKETLIGYAANNNELKKKIGLLLLKFLEGGLKITNKNHIVNKKVRSTPNNKKSSRSHAVIIVELKTKNNLIICDLAGVENKFNCNNSTIINFFKKINELYMKKKKKNNSLSFFDFVSSYDWFRPFGFTKENSTDFKESYNTDFELINNNLEKIEDGLRISEEDIKKMDNEYKIKNITKNFLVSKGTEFKKNNFNKIKEYLKRFVDNDKGKALINRLESSYQKEKWWEYLNDELYGKDEKINYNKIELGKKELNKTKEKIKNLKNKRNNAKKIIDSTLWKHITTICEFSSAEGTKIINKELQDLEKDLISQVINSGKITINEKKVNPIYRNSTSFDCYKLAKEKYELFYTSENEDNYKSKIFSNFLPEGEYQNFIVLSTVFDLRIHDFSKLPRNFPPPIPYISLKPFLNNNDSKTVIVNKILNEISNSNGYKGYKEYLPSDFKNDLKRTDNSFKNLIKYIESLNSITAIGVIETVSKIKNLFFCSKDKKPKSKIEQTTKSESSGGYYNKYIKYKKKYYDLKYN